MGESLIKEQSNRSATANPNTDVEITDLEREGSRQTSVDFPENQSVQIEDNNPILATSPPKVEVIKPKFFRAFEDPPYVSNNQQSFRPVQSSTSAPQLPRKSYSEAVAESLVRPSPFRPQSTRPSPSATVTSGEYNLQQLQEQHLNQQEYYRIQNLQKNEYLKQQELNQREYLKQQELQQQEYLKQQQELQQREYLKQQELQQQELQQQEYLKQQQEYLKQQQEYFIQQQELQRLRDFNFKEPFPPLPDRKNNPALVPNQAYDQSNAYYQDYLKQKKIQESQVQQQLNQIQQQEASRLSDLNKLNSSLNSSIEKAFNKSISFDCSSIKLQKKTRFTPNKEKNTTATAHVARIYDKKITNKFAETTIDRRKVIEINEPEDISKMYEINSPAQNSKPKIAIIGGTGLDENLDIFKNKVEVDLPKTPYGEPSDSKIVKGKLFDMEVYIMARHGKKHLINPSDVNYRANIWALKELGVHIIIATTACGSLKPEIKPGHLVVLDQYIDRTKGNRKGTFFKVAHIPQNEPFDEDVRQFLIEACQQLRYDYAKEGTAVTIEGPRFSTKAESKLYQCWGAHIVNMTSVPEAQLAAELGIHYGALALVTDYDCWHEDPEESVNVKLVEQRLK